MASTGATTTNPSSPYRLSLTSQQSSSISPKTAMSSEGYGSGSGRQSVSGSYSARSESSDVYANYSALHLHKLSNFTNAQQQQQHIRSPLTKVPLVIPKSMAQGGSEMSLASSTGSYGIIGSEERYEAEIRKLNYELENYRQTITKLTAKHDNYNQVIHMFDSRLQMLVRHVSKLNQKSQLKEEEVEKLKSQIEYLRSLSSCATVPDSSLYGKVVEHHVGEHHLQRHPSMESVASHRSSLSTSSKSSRLDKNGLSKGGKKSSWVGFLKIVYKD
jgi:hypothetical protein